MKRAISVRFDTQMQGRFRWLSGLWRRSAATRLLRLWVRIPPEPWLSVSWVLCAVRWRSLWRGVLPTVVRRCVWCRNLVNEKAMARVGRLHHTKNNIKAEKTWKYFPRTYVAFMTLKANFAYNLHEVTILPNALCSLICYYILTHAVFLPQVRVIFDVMTSICLMLNHRRPTELRAWPYPISTQKKNSVALVRTRTIPTERPPPVGEVSANFCG